MTRCSATQTQRANVHTCILTDPHNQHRCVCGWRWTNEREDP